MEKLEDQMIKGGQSLIDPDQEEGEGFSKSVVAEPKTESRYLHRIDLSEF